MSKLRGLVRCFYKAAENTINNDGIEHAGYMAFLSILSFFPFLVFIVAISGFIGESEAGTKFVSFLLNSLPFNVSSALEPRIKEIVSGPPQGLLTIAILGAIWTASSSVEGLRTILNRVYKVKAPPAYILRRLLSIVQFLMLTALIVLTTLLLVIIPIIWVKLSNVNVIGDQLDFIIEKVNSLSPIWNYLRYLVIAATLFFVVATIYYVIPNAKLKLISIVPGALLVVVLWLMGAYLLSLYISHFKQVNLIYGSLGGIIITLLFFYIINLILIYGAEFNYLLNKYLIINNED